MNKSCCCSSSCRRRLSSVEVTLATRAATCALSLTYRSMPSWNVVGDLLLVEIRNTAPHR